MNEKFLEFLSTNGIDKDDAVSQIFLLLLKQGEELQSLKKDIGKIDNKGAMLEQLRKIVREDLVIGVENAKVEIDYDRLAASMIKIGEEEVEKEEVPIEARKDNEKSRVGFFTIMQGLFFNERVMG